MIPLNYMLKCTEMYTLIKLQENIYHPIYGDDIQIFGNDADEIKTLLQLLFSTMKLLECYLKLKMLSCIYNKKETEIDTKEVIDLCNQESINGLEEKHSHRYQAILDVDTTNE